MVEILWIMEVLKMKNPLCHCQGLLSKPCRHVEMKLQHFRLRASSGLGFKRLGFRV